MDMTRGVVPKSNDGGTQYLSSGRNNPWNSEGCADGLTYWAEIVRLFVGVETGTAAFAVPFYAGFNVWPLINTPVGLFGRFLVHGCR